MSSNIQRPDFELNRTLTLRSHATMELSIEQVTRLLSEGDLATPVMESRCSVKVETRSKKWNGLSLPPPSSVDDVSLS